MLNPANGCGNLPTVSKHTPAKGGLLISCHRDLQPPPVAATGWPQQREVILQTVTAVLEGGSGGSSEEKDGGPAAVDVAAIAAADRAMQELLVSSTEGSPNECQHLHGACMAQDIHQLQARMSVGIRAAVVAALPTYHNET
jgi:hypothetical protein